jgi:ABC-type nickel/cobalt efflux system permease component RcnA
MPETGTDVLSLLFLGFFFGMRHATDPDHVVAIATIVSRQRTVRGSAMIGAAWGVGHTITIMVVGGAIILFGVVIPPRLGLSMEFAVGIMLFLLGVLTLTGAGQIVRVAGRGHSHEVRLDAPVHTHAHGDYVHSHIQVQSQANHGHPEDRTPIAWLDRSSFGYLTLYQWLRPFVVGLVHGLAGSSAVALLVLTVIRDPVWAMGYLLLFGIGTIGGMMLITMALSAPFALTSFKLTRLNWQLRVASGLISFVFGLFLIYDLGFAQGGLFTDSPSWIPS